jgi:hypothetical protein
MATESDAPQGEVVSLNGVNRIVGIIGGAETIPSAGSSRARGKRVSGIFLVAQPRQELARGVIFGVADNCHTDPEQRR